MKKSLISTLSIAILLVTTTELVGCGINYPQKTLTDASATTITQTIGGVQLPPVDPQYRNEWTPELETQLQKRAAAIIRYYTNPSGGYGSAYGENEKRAYPRAMFDFLAGNREKALIFLQQEDPQQKDHIHTDGIDYYYSFTLKGQIRKYFLLGQFLDPAYKQRMFNGAKKWTESDPLLRPHPIYGYGDGSGRDWDISKRGLWVDGRNTDNLRAMRETSVYLMAEETGNEETRLIYKQKIQRYVWALYHIGMGEWDSEVYHGHTFAPYLNLYDFTKDPEVKLLAKAALDWMSAAAAIKYYRGGWGGPVKRDYGKGNLAMSSSAARTFWLYFGDTPLPNSNPETDSLFFITSTYRPPLAVVALAHKNFAKPVEILSTHPLYENWKLGYDRQPGYWETQFFGHTYQMGSLAGTFADGDVAPFKLMAYNQERGVDYFVANTGGSWVQPGKRPGDQIGQYQNLLIWLRPANEPFFFQLPKSAKLEVENNIWFVKLEKTWLAIHPINLNPYSLIEIADPKLAEIYHKEQTLKSIPVAGKYAGFTLEVGEEKTYGNYEQFKKNVREKSKLNLRQLEGGQIVYTSSQNKSLELTYNQINLLPILKRDKKEHNWENNFALYNSLNSNKRPISLGWKRGKLKIKAGGFQFKTEVNREKKVL